MFAIAHFRLRWRRASVLLPTLFVIIFITMLLSAILPLTVTGYGLSRADRDRACALAAAEAGLNWEIGRIDNRRWDKDDSGNTAVTASGSTTLDTWPSTTGAAPSTASTVVLTTDAKGNWTQRLLVGTSLNPFTLRAGQSLAITAEGQVRAADGHIVKRRVVCGGGGLTSLFDTMAIFAFSPATSSASPAWSVGGSSTIVGGCGSNGLISGNGGPTITTGPLGLWGPNASVSGVTVAAGVPTMIRPAIFTTETVDAAASLLYSKGASSTTYNVRAWAPAGYDASGNSTGPADWSGRNVNSQAEIVTNAPGTASDGVFVRAVKANEFLDSNNQPVLDGHLVSGSNQRLRLKPGVYYFAAINLLNSATVEIANDWYKADGQTPLWDAFHQPINGPATVSDYDSMGNRITLFVDAVTVSQGSNPYLGSGVGSGLFTALQGDMSTTNALRYRRPGNFRLYAKNTGDFTVNGSSSSPLEFDCNLLHYNKDPSSGNYYGAVSLRSGCHLYGGLFGWTVNMSGGATVQQYGTGMFSPNDPVTFTPFLNPGGPAGSGGGVTGGFGGWQWREVAAS